MGGLLTILPWTLEIKVYTPPAQELTQSNFPMCQFPPPPSQEKGKVGLKFKTSPRSPWQMRQLCGLSYSS